MCKPSVIVCVALAAQCCAPTLKAADETKVNSSVTRAIAYLKTTYGTVAPEKSGGLYEEGPAALAGIAMIEAGVTLDDPAIKAIAKVVRAASLTSQHTYQMSLDIIFLDKLGEASDTLLIQQLGARLIKGMIENTGAWTYNCPGLSPDMLQRFRGVLDGASMQGSNTLPTPGARPRLNSLVEQLLQGQGLVAAPMTDRVPPDNSNTQFAIIALWSARKHGLPVEPTFKAVEARFRSMQDRGGGWYYALNATQVTPSMTCAGLLGLAVVAGLKSERSMRSRGTVGPDGKLDLGPSGQKNQGPDPFADPAAKAGIAYLGSVIQQSANGSPAAPANNGGPKVSDPTGGDLRGDYYFMWSLERVCVVFGLKSLGGRNWHEWGAAFLLAKQNESGSWSGKYGPEIDTSFALMFMCRSNIVRDLSGIRERSMKGGSAAPETSGSAPKPNPAGSGVSKIDESEPLTKALLAAAPAKQLELIHEYTKEKGKKYSLGLANAIPKLKGDALQEARDGLAQRMARLSAESLKEYLDSLNAELCRAACLGVAMREEKTLIPDLIQIIQDEQDELVWRAAALSLKAMTGQDFGPKKGATADQRTQAAAEWRKWHEKNKG